MTFRLSSRRASSWLILTVALAVAIATALSQFGQAADRALDPLRFAAVSRPASGKVVVVEMDAASISKIDRWPWPRDHYVAVVDRLAKAGAADIVFDVDFSSPSTPDGDRAFAAAIVRAKGLVALPTFAQRAAMDDDRSIDALPIASLRKDAMLASVSISPDPDGIVRRAPLATMTQGTPRPSLSAYIARASGTADRLFPIDYGIEPATIPRLSFIAVRDGHFDPSAIAGKSVLIGATAVEMGDRYGVPRWGVQPGVVVQALAAESLLAGIPDNGSPLVGLVAASLLGFLILAPRAPRWAAMACVYALAALCTGAVMAQAQIGIVYPLAPALILVMVATIGRFARDIIERFAAQRSIDDESGLPNRRGLIGSLAGRPEFRLAVAHIDNFDELAAVVGREADSVLIQRVAERLKLVAIDGEVFRLTNRMLGFPLADEAYQDALDGLRAVMLRPMEIAGRQVDIVMTIGVSVCRCGIDACLAEAALAADEARRDGAFWRQTEVDRASLERQTSLMGELDQALTDRAIEVHYQPKLDLAANAIGSVEALVRWPHTVRGFIGPDQFIPLAEQSNRIAALTLYVIERTMQDLAAWHRQGFPIKAAVNISAKLVASDDFDLEVRRLFDRGPVAPASLIFEVTETAAIDDPERARIALERYRAMGIAISLDDYGTGQSTLSHLRHLPLSELKMDRSFVQHAHENRNDSVLVRSTIDLAHALGLKVVAEGVEDTACLDFLRSAGCDVAQGYLISRPVTAAALMELLIRDAGSKAA
ncbi:EAL domain-containing protein [Sphingomonas sp. 1P06PA]|uniref:putative bifunctional diguanylate cyclase/phosphodiesterase n=1 Tax=Sphingomonas sp. 1P06PA TaxID=554121 RepID=UPI0039A50761